MWSWFESIIITYMVTDTFPSVSILVWILCIYVQYECMRHNVLVLCIYALNHRSLVTPHGVISTPNENWYLQKEIFKMLNTCFTFQIAAASSGDQSDNVVLPWEFPYFKSSLTPITHIVSHFLCFSEPVDRSARLWELPAARAPHAQTGPAVPSDL